MSYILCWMSCGLADLVTESDCWLGVKSHSFCTLYSGVCVQGE